MSAPDTPEPTRFAEYVAVPTAWGGWIARTPEGHRFRLAAVEATPSEARRKLAEAVAAWESLAAAGGVS